MLAEGRPIAAKPRKTEQRQAISTHDPATSTDPQMATSIKAATSPDPFIGTFIKAAATTDPQIATITEAQQRLSFPGDRRPTG